MKCVIVLFLLLLLPFVYASDLKESIPATDTLTVIPGEEYQAGWLHRLFFGKHWRSLWTSPLTVPVIDLENFAGGLTPFKRGGGFQTKSLHFKAGNGKYYKFRSINKDPKKVLPYYLQETFVAEVVQDQISTSHPFSAFIVAPLLNAVGVLNAQPLLVVLPDDPILGDYRDEFKNVLGTIAENPKDDTEAGLIFAGADKVIDDYKIFEKLEENNRNQVHAQEYLKARLMDIFLGDWDRHVGQWKWARFKNNSVNIYRPIPRDRDQAFSRYDGILPFFAAKAVTQIEHFSADYPQINDLTWSGRHLDRRILVSLTQTSWDSITTYMFNQLTDSVISRAVRRMPASWFKQEGEVLVEQLKSRRDRLPDISEKYYKLIFKYVSIYASDKAEYAIINRNSDKTVHIQIFDKDKAGEAKDTPFYDRSFNLEHTKEIRIDLLGGDDTAVVEGTVDNSILVRVIGGQGKDALIDNSHVHGYFLSITPIPTASRKTIFYDHNDETIFKSGQSTRIVTDKPNPPKPFNPETDEINEKYEPQTEDRGHDWRAGAILNYNSDDGLIIGGGPILYEFGFRAKPYVYRMELTGSYATNSQGLSINYLGEFYSMINHWRVLLDFGKTELDFTRFYGFGNGTLRDAELDDQDFYRVGQDFVYLRTYFQHQSSKYSRFGFGTAYHLSELSIEPGTILDQPDYEDFIGRDDISFVGLHAGFNFDSRDHLSAPFSGFYFDFKGSLFPRILGNDNPYGKIQVMSSSYLTSRWITEATLALRVGGEKIWGNFPLYDAAFIGGEDNIRGFNRHRFAGSASAYGNAEWRVFLFPTKIIIPARFGFSALIESGRVFHSCNQSEKWHTSYGGGLWISFVERLAVANLTVARSIETISFYATFGFMF